MAPLSDHPAGDGESAGDAPMPAGQAPDQGPDSAPGQLGPADAGASEILQGTVERVTWRGGEGSSFSVLKIAPEAGFGDPEDPARGLGFEPPRAPVFAVGPAPIAAEGMRLRLGGHWTTHARHGRRFEFEQAELLPPVDRHGLVRYLASKAFPGIGPVLAERIADALGEGGLETLRREPARLVGIPGLPSKARLALLERLASVEAHHELRAFLLGAGLASHQVDAVARKLGGEGLEQLRADPYRIASGIHGVGFHSADRVARRIGTPLDGPERARAALVHTLEEASGEGHSLLPAPALLERAAVLLRGEMPRATLERALDELGRTEELGLESDLRPGERLAYLPVLRACESGVAHNAARLAGHAVAPLATRAELAAAEQRTGLELDPAQREAVLGLLASPVGLLTGGPGVGKTTAVRLLVELAAAAGARVALASPTGRAARRLSEATGHEAATLHRLLGWHPERGGFAHDDRRHLEVDLLVVDEVSMLDVVLAHQLLRALRPGTRLVLVGDPDQLPSVAAGNVLADLIASGRVPVWRLDQIHRQAERSRIVSNARRILAGEWPEFSESGEEGADCFFFPADDERAAADRLVEVVTRRIPQRFGLDWQEEVQVLAPMYRGACGVDALNERLRETRGPAGAEIPWGNRVLRLGDRVIQTRNDYDKQVFNGDLGRVERVAPDGSGLTVAFPDRRVTYLREELGALLTAFAITVHRSQGSEFPAVVVPLVTQHYLMLQRHLLYTAVTRAQRLLVLVGSRRALRIALDHADQARRESALVERLRRAIPGA